jgi:hypothetical protein
MLTRSAESGAGEPVSRSLRSAADRRSLSRLVRHLYHTLYFQREESLVRQRKQVLSTVLALSARQRATATFVDDQLHRLFHDARQPVVFCTAEERRTAERAVASDLRTVESALNSRSAAIEYFHREQLQMIPDRLAAERYERLAANKAAMNSAQFAQAVHQQVSAVKRRAANDLRQLGRKENNRRQIQRLAAGGRV